MLRSMVLKHTPLACSTIAKRSLRMVLKIPKPLCPTPRCCRAVGPSGTTTASKGRVGADLSAASSKHRLSGHLGIGGGQRVEVNVEAIGNQGHAEFAVAQCAALVCIPSAPHSMPFLVVAAALLIVSRGLLYG